jgi:hypothetical protein
VEFYPQRLWWLEAIPSAGKLIIISASGYKRKFILLGKVDGAAIRGRILSDAAAV